MMPLDLAIPALGRLELVLYYRDSATLLGAAVERPATIDVVWEAGALRTVLREGTLCFAVPLEGSNVTVRAGAWGSNKVLQHMRPWA